MLSRFPLKVPPGYFYEQPLEPLYANDHDNLMTWIIQTLNKRAEEKKQLRKTTPKTPTQTNIITLDPDMTPYICTCTTHLETCIKNQHDLTVDTNVDCLKRLFVHTFEQIYIDYKKKIDQPNYNVEINAFLYTITPTKPRRSQRHQSQSQPITHLKSPMTKQQIQPKRKRKLAKNNPSTINPDVQQTLDLPSHPDTQTTNDHTQVHVPTDDDMILETQLDNYTDDDIKEEKEEKEERDEKHNTEEKENIDQTQQDKLQRRIDKNIIIQRPGYDENEDLGEIDDESVIDDGLIEEEKQELALVPLEKQLELIRTEFSIEHFKIWQLENKKVSNIIQQVRTQQDNPSAIIHKTYCIKNDILYINNNTLRAKYDHHKNNKRIIKTRKEWSIYVPNTTIPNTTLPIKWYIVRQVHGLPCSGHLGVNSTYFLIREHFYWPGMIKDVRKWIQSCQPCQKRKVGKNISVGDHKSVLQLRPFEVVSMDTVGPFPTTPEGYKYILTMICNFSRFPICVPIVDKTEKTIAAALIKHLFLQYPFWPRKILSDKGTEFRAKLINEIYDKLHIKQVFTSHDNPQGNSQIERLHRYLSAAISVFANTKNKRTRWTDYLDSAVFVYRATVNHATGYSPFYTLYGKEPVRPIDFLLSSQIEEQKFSSNTEYVQDILSTFTDCYNDIHQNQLTQSIRNMKLNQKQVVSYDVGDLVYVWRRYKPPKVEWKYEGPYTVVEKVTDQTYKVKIGTYATTHPTKSGQDKIKQVKVTHLRSYNPFDDNIEDTSPPLVEESSHDVDQSQQQQPIHVSQTPEPDMFTIIPHYAWHEIELEQRTWSLGKILHTTDKHVVVHRYGSESGNYLHKQKPGYVFRNVKKQLKIRYTKNPDTSIGGPYTAYTNKMNSKELDHEYTYPIKKKWLLFSGFNLTDDDRIPTTILQQIEDNEYINSTIKINNNPHKKPSKNK